VAWYDWITSWYRAETREYEIPAGAISPAMLPMPAIAEGSYGLLYRTQPAVRICVDFLARNIAQLGLHLYRRLPDDSRERVRDHPIVRLLEAPNPGTTRYTLVEQLVVDLSVYGNAFWYVSDTTPTRLVWLPASRVAIVGTSRPQGYALLGAPGEPSEPLDPTRMVHVKYANPEHPAIGLSPLSSLKTRLTEEAAMDQYRIYFWRNYARLGGVIERPKDAPRWTPEQQASFAQQWHEAFSGLANQGKTPVLPDGMTFKELSSSAREAQYTEAKKATRAEVAAIYMIPMAMVGLLEGANYANMREQHNQLYTDCLPPLTERIAQELERVLFPLYSGTEGLYFEFNIFEKLRGSFEEQATSLRASVGTPFLSVNEARSRLNLPRLEDPAFDVPAIPLNVQAGAGQITDVNVEQPVTPPATEWVN
jgi:HK97 family phage portal protein